MDTARAVPARQRLCGEVSQDDAVRDTRREVQNGVSHIRRGSLMTPALENVKNIARSYPRRFLMILHSGRAPGNHPIP